MYAICKKVAFHDNRDCFAGWNVYRVNQNAYETLELAFKLKPSDYDEHGQCDESILHCIIDLDNHMEIMIKSNNRSTYHACGEEYDYEWRNDIPF